MWVLNLSSGWICDSTRISRWRYCLLLSYVRLHLLGQNLTSWLIIHSAIAGTTPLYNNFEFINNFNQSFMNFVLAQDSNVKWDSANTVPSWPRWTEEGRAEMFNKTEAHEPVFQNVNTKNDLLRRSKLETMLLCSYYLQFLGKYWSIPWTVEARYMSCSGS